MAGEDAPNWHMPAAHSGLHLASHEALITASAAGRHLCPQCKKSRSLYCFDCIIPLTEGVPRVEWVRAGVGVWGGGGGGRVPTAFDCGPGRCPTHIRRLLGGDILLQYLSPKGSSYKDAIRAFGLQLEAGADTEPLGGDGCRAGRW